MAAPQRVSVRVAASTSNLGPGFDFLGLALGMFVELEAEVREGDPPTHDRASIDCSYSGVDGPVVFPRGEGLVERAIAMHAGAHGLRAPSLEVRVKSEVPIGRGFGSSGAAVAAGLLAASAIAGERTPNPNALAPLALALEGHPDNGTASLFGGCTLAVPVDSSDRGERSLVVVHQHVHPSIAFAVAWPDEPLTTEDARKALPDSVPFADAIENPRRLALLLEGLRTGRGDLIGLGVQDHIHERHRRALIPGSDDACRAALDSGAYAACLSGAGSGLVALGPRESIEDVRAALEEPLVDGRSRVVEYAPEPPVVEVH